MADKRVAAKSCPACNGATGYEVDTTETHIGQFGEWGESPAHGESGCYVRRSLARCLDCGAKFNFDALARKGLA